MPLLAGDIRFARSANMADVPEGGGPPSAQLLVSGRSNDILPDISEETRTVGRVEIYQIFGVLRNTDRAALQGANVILGEPPADPNVSITLLSLKDPFATRAEIARRIESGMSTGPEFAGYLLENHFTTMRSLQILQRPGSGPPGIGKTFVLVYQEGQSGERRQRVRIKASDTITRTFTEIVNGQLVDFPAQVTTVELFDGLAFDFPGSPPTRTYARGAGRTLIRETVYTDAGLFYSAGRLTAASQINDVWLQVDSIYTQVVPNSRTEAATVDQRPASQRTMLLAAAPRLIEVGITPHTQRIKIGEANAGLTYVAQLRPLPEPGLVFIDFWALGNRYTLTDDGEGKLSGAGGGSVSYLTGSVSITLGALPDIGTSLGITWGERTAYTNRAGQGPAVRPPEYAFMIESDDPYEQVVAGTLSISYTSANVVHTITDNGAGKLSGAAQGVIDYIGRNLLVRPTHMPDPGAEFDINCQLVASVTELISAPSPDAGGFIQLSLAQQPTAGTLSVKWATARSVSNTSGGQLSHIQAIKNTNVTYTVKSVPEYYESAAPTVVNNRLPSGWQYIPMDEFWGTLA